MLVKYFICSKYHLEQNFLRYDPNYVSSKTGDSDDKVTSTTLEKMHSPPFLGLMTGMTKNNLYMFYSSADIMKTVEIACLPSNLLDDEEVTCGHIL